MVRASSNRPRDAKKSASSSASSSSPGDLTLGTRGAGAGSGARLSATSIDASLSGPRGKLGSGAFSGLPNGSSVPRLRGDGPASPSSKSYAGRGASSVSYVAFEAASSELGAY